RELALAHRQGKAVVPTLFSDRATMPPKRALPDDLKFLSSLQFIRLDFTRSDYFDAVVKCLEENGFKSLPKVEFSRPPIDHSRYRQADEEQIAEFTQSNSAWARVNRDGAEGVERAYTFDSFSDAVRFVSAASWDIAVVRHYPEWQHVYQTVRVFYSTLDLGR